MVDLAETIFRDFEADGVPASGAHKPKKEKIREWGSWLEGMISAFVSNGGLIYDTRASLFADLAHAANSSAWVVADPTGGYNGIYRKAGASGVGSWTRVADLPYSFIRLNDAGAGTANAIVATSSMPLPAAASAALLVMNVFEANTGPVTIVANGAVAKPLKTNSGNDLAASYLTAGMMVSFIDDGTNFRLLSDVASAAIVAAADAARIAAEAAAASLNLPVMAPGDAGRQLFARGDAGGYDLLPGMLNVMSFIPSAHWAGIRDRTITADLSAYLQDALDVAGDRGELVFFPGGRYSHATGLVYGPQPTSYTPSGDTGTSDLHFMQVPQAVIFGVGFAELYATAAMAAQLTVTYQNGKNAPSMTRVEGMFFNGQGVAERGLKSQWVFGAEYICNRFDGHTIVNVDHEGRAHLRFAHNILRGQRNVICRVGGDSNFSGNDFYLRGGAAATRRGIEFGPETGNTVVDKTNVFTLETSFNVDNTNSVAIYIDGVSTYLGNTGNRDFQIDGCEFHGVETGVFAEGTNNGLLRNIDVINCHAFQGAQSKVTLAKLVYVNKANIVGNRSNTLGSRSTLPGIVLSAVQNVEIAGNHIGGVTGTEAIQIAGNSIDVNVHDNHFLEAVNTAHAYILVDGSSLVSIHDNHAQQYSAYTTKFVREVGAGTVNVYGDNHLSASFTDPYDVANVNTTYRGRDYSGASQATVAAGSTNYLGENGNQSAEYLTAWVNSSKAKYAKRLAVQVNAAPGASQSFTYTLTVDGVDTALTAQIAGAATFSAVDIDHEAAIALGSRFAVKLVTSAGAAVTAHRVALTLV